MADLADVENALVALISQVLYPTGVLTVGAGLGYPIGGGFMPQQIPSSQPAVTGVPTIVYAGWPMASRLDADLLALSQAPATGKIHVTVFPTNTERNTTRYMRQWQTVTPASPTLTLTINGQQVTVGGAVSAPQNAVLMVGYQPYVYAVQASDTLSSIAAALAALVPGASSAGPVITLSSSGNLIAARVGAGGTSIMEIRRQERVMQITVWADTPGRRDATIQAIDPVLANTEFLTLADQTAARLIYRSSRKDDIVQKAKLYRRDLMYSVEYATTIIETDTQITQTQLNTSAAVAGVPPYQPVQIAYD